MAQLIGRLAALEVQRVKKPGMYAHGAGLYLQVTCSGDRVPKSWIYRFTLRNRAREMGLGSADPFGRTEARTKARKCRQLVYDGVDPIEARKAEKARSALETAKTLSFKECAEKYIATHKAGWRSAKHASQGDAR
jgi:hypothetical protein